MKKLKLSLSNLDGVEILSRSQLKEIMGGESGSGCKFTCSGPCRLLSCGDTPNSGYCLSLPGQGCVCMPVC